jgi:hypothetical protein
MTRARKLGAGEAALRERAAPELRPRVGRLKASIQFVQQYTPILKAPNGERHVARAYMSRQPGGLWEGWLVFFSLRTRVALATDRETTQSTREHVLYWATGLGETYLQGALERALDRRPEVQLARRVARAERQKAYALAEAEIYAAAAASALRDARRAGRRRQRASEALRA